MGRFLRCPGECLIERFKLEVSTRCLGAGLSGSRASGVVQGSGFRVKGLGFRRSGFRV